MNEEDLTRRQRLTFNALALCELPAFVLMLAGAYASLAWRPAAFAMVAGLLATIIVHLARGALSYRIVMAREWPQVAPIDDDDW